MTTKMADHVYMVLAHLFLFLFGVYCKQPNILFILADDYGWNDVGYHHSEINTPNLDNLARQGIKLENYYVQPICTPTRSQLLSGRYQIHTGLQHGIIWAPQANGLPLEIPTVANKLKDEGYSTHIVGKWHLGFYKKEYMPTNRGFDTHFGYLTGSEDYRRHDRCSSMFENIEEKKKYCGIDLRNNMKPYNDTKQEYSTFLFAEKAEEIVANHNPDKPLFLYLPFQAVHSPLEAPQQYIDQYDWIKDKARRKYAGMVTCMDEAVGNVTKAFKKYGLWENTILIFSTDNGGQVLSGGNNWPLRGWKGSLWEGGMKAVGFVNSPLLANAGQTNYQLMHVTDWFPTLVSLAGGSTEGLALDGFNQWPSISENKPTSRRMLLHNIDILTSHVGKPVYNGTFDTRVRAALRMDNWKIITGNPGPSTWVPPPHLSTIQDLEKNSHTTDSNQNLWLFDVIKDPEERYDLSNEHPEIVKEMLDHLLYYNSTAVPPRYPPFDPRCNPALHGGFWGPWE